MSVSIKPGAIVDDPKRYAALWMDRTALASAFQLSGAFNEISVRLSPGASEQAVRRALDRVLARAVFVVGADNSVKHVEYVNDIANHPDYEAALAAAK